LADTLLTNSTSDIFFCHQLLPKGSKTSFVEARVITINKYEEPHAKKLACLIEQVVPTLFGVR
jgi:hypothetical protein